MKLLKIIYEVIYIFKISLYFIIMDVSVLQIIPNLCDYIVFVLTLFIINVAFIVMSRRSGGKEGVREKLEKGRCDIVWGRPTGRKRRREGEKQKQILEKSYPPNSINIPLLFKLEKI